MQRRLGKRRDLSTAGAALLGITDGTARQYLNLKAAFRKTHAHRQADLVRIVGGMLAQ